MTTVRGFILTAHCFDVKGNCELHYYGTGETGTFKLIFTGHEPLFFIDRNCPPEHTAALKRKPVGLRNISGTAVDVLYFNSLDNYYNTRRRFQEKAIRIYESDVRAEDRFLMERFINSSLLIEGVPQRVGGLNVYTNPRIKAAEYRPKLKWLSIDIETGIDGSIYSVAFHLTQNNAAETLVLMRGEQTDGSGGILYCSDEKSLLRQFVGYITEKNPDLIIGWHVIGFDLSFIKNRADALGISLKIGRGFRQMKLGEKRSGMFTTMIEGRLVIDGPQTLRTAFYKFENYKLETVSQELLGRGKRHYTGRRQSRRD